MTALALARFDDEGPYLRARARLLGAGHRVVGEWLPYAADSLGHGDGERGIRLGVVLVGITGTVALLALTAWSAIVAYPFDSGGRPLWSWPAFLPAPIEFGALTAAIGGMILFFRNARLTRLHDAAFDFPEVAEASAGAFVLAVGCDAGEEANAVLALLAETGAVHSRLVTR
jgi:hypothetical protein